MTKMYPRDNNHNPVIVTGFGGKDGQRRELTMPVRYAINAILVALRLLFLSKSAYMY